MAKKQKYVPPSTREEKIAHALKQFNLSYTNTPEPNRFFNIGDRVVIGNLKNVEVEEIHNDGKAIVVSYDNSTKQYIDGISTIVTERVYGVWAWYNVFFENNSEPLSRRRRIHQAITTSLSGLLSKVLYFGLNDNPAYQRDYVWTMDDKVRLIESIMVGRDIGKFVIVDKKYPELDCIIDGKQRLNAITEFYLGKFPYKGKFFHELNTSDRYNFSDLQVQIISLNDNTPETEVLELFIEMNYSGVPQTEEHIEKVRGMLNELIAENKDAV